MYGWIYVYFIIGGVLSALGIILMIGKERKPVTPGAASVLVLLAGVNIALDTIMWMGTR